MRLPRFATALVALPWISVGAQSLDARITAYVAARPGPVFSGVIAIARRGQVMVNHAYGFADADLAVPNQITHRYGIGSLTKPLTATAALRLVERGQLRLDDPICKYLRQCPPAWRSVTIEHLLAHTSGVPDVFSELPAVSPDSMRIAIDAGIARHASDALLSAPGERYVYNNFGYFLLAYAIEAATGRSWEAVLRTEVFDRAGMPDTEYDRVWQVMPRRARGYQIVRDSLQHIRYHDHGAYAAGGLLSTVADLLRFDEALEDGRLLADSTRRSMFTVRRGDYALGWQLTTAFGRQLRNHTGGTNGFSSWLGRFDDGTTVVILSNVEGARAAKDTGCDIAALVFGLSPSPRNSASTACRSQP